MIEAIDREALIELFEKRLDAGGQLDADGDATRAYWAGRIDGHCLQNAIHADDLFALARAEGHRIDWTCALLEVPA